MRSLVRGVPRRHIWEKIKQAWFEAFPQEVNVKTLQQERKSQAKLQKKIKATDYSAEEIDELENRIPEWKRGALTFVKFLESTDAVLTKQAKVSNYIRRRYKDNADIAALLDELEGVKDSFQVMKDNLHQRVLYSNSVIIKTGITATSKIREKLNADALAEMKRRDSSFDIDIFEKEIRFIFEEAYHEFLNHNSKYLEKICAGEALAHFRGMINEHKAKFGVPKYKDILNVSFPVLEASFVTEDKIPIFCLSMNFQEIFCLIDPKNPETILDGNETRMNMCDYVVYVMPHPEPDIEAVGHGWMFFNIIQRNKVRQLI